LSQTNCSIRCLLSNLSSISELYTANLEACGFYRQMRMLTVDIAKALPLDMEDPGKIKIAISSPEVCRLSKDWDIKPIADWIIESQVLV